MPAYERYYKSKFTLSFGASDTTKQIALGFTGEVKAVLASIPNFTNDVTATISLKDSEGRTYYTSSALTKNAAHNLTLSEIVPCDDLFYLVVALSAAPGSTGEVVVVFRYRGEK